MKLNRNMVGWFEIPVTDMDRAVHFYKTVFDVELRRVPLGTLEMAWFPFEEDKEGSPGSLVLQREHYVPSQNGVLIYFSSQTGDLDDQLKRVENAGGTLLKSKTKISDDHGFMALFLDTEGNRIAIHSRK